MTPLLTGIARRKKVRFFFRDVPKSAKILEIGCADKWLGRELERAGFASYTGLDLAPPADIVGDIRDWKDLRMQAASFDIIVAFELVEHVDCFKEMSLLLRSGGSLFLTSPRPEMDWLCRILEMLHLTQRRTSPHDHLIDFRKIPYFVPRKLRRVGLASQWGVFKKFETP